EALLAFVWPGFGDQFLAYNIPGRPVFDVLTAVFFTIGLFVVVLAFLRRPMSRRQWSLPYTFLLFWFLAGILPSLITGPTANTTRNLAALPVVHILPAVGFVVLIDWVSTRWLRAEVLIIRVMGVIWLLFAGSVAVHDYFVRWGEAPDVRGAYQVTQLAMFDYLSQQEENAPAVISTVYPGPAHDPSIALVTYPQLNLRWADARYALVWPHGQAAHAIIPASTPPHAAFAEWLHPVETVAMRTTDLDPTFTYYELEALPAAWMDTPPLANFDEALLLQHAHWLADGVRAGETAVLLTVWRVADPTRVGPLRPETETTDAVMFTQVLDGGNVLAQRDALDAPSWDWQSGDVIVQLHPVSVPVTAVPGEYQTIVGLYDRSSG
ncbi:MAG: hypothetical protein KC413_16830, partial [Anaerolineales bacterium]|nr:hypothetical protein [Anaerolineales bacterium]